MDGWPSWALQHWRRGVTERTWPWPTRSWPTGMATEAARFTRTAGDTLKKRQSETREAGHQAQLFLNQSDQVMKQVKNTGTKWELWKVLKTLTRSIAGTLALCGPRVNCPASLDTRPSTGSRASRDNDAGCPLSGHEGWSDKYYYR